MDYILEAEEVHSRRSRNRLLEEKFRGVSKSVYYVDQLLSDFFQSERRGKIVINAEERSYQFDLDMFQIPQEGLDENFSIILPFEGNSYFYYGGILHEFDEKQFVCLYEDGQFFIRAFNKTIAEINAILESLALYVTFNCISLVMQ